MSTVIVDDQDARVSYSGSWTRAGSDVNYSGTVTSSNVADSSLTFTFSGTRVIIVGDFNVGGSCASRITLDGQQVFSFTSPVVNVLQHQQTIYSSDSIPDGQHTLIFTISSCQASGGGNTGTYLSVDYLLYDASAQASADGLTFFIDDIDSSLSYTGNWTAEGDDSDFRKTRHRGNSGASMQYLFTGNYISVHGRVNNSTGTVQGSFSLDGATPTSFTAPPQTSVSFNKELFTEPSISLGQHTLMVTSQGDNPLLLDYILIRAGSVPPSSPPPASQHSGLPIGAIVGIAVGAAVFLAVIVFFILFRRRSLLSRRKQDPPTKNTAQVSAAETESILYRTGDGYSTVPPPRPPRSPVNSTTALLSTSHNYPPSSLSYTDSFEHSSIQHPVSPPVPPPPPRARSHGRMRSTSNPRTRTAASTSRSPSPSYTLDSFATTVMTQATSFPVPRARPHRTRSHSHSRARTDPSAAAASNTSTTSTLTRMRSVTVSEEYAESEASVSTRRTRRELPQVPASTASTPHVDSGFRMTMTSFFGDDGKAPPEPPPAYTPK